MRKKWKNISLAAALALLLASSVTVFAEDRQGASGWQVSFDGKKMESNFTSGNMTEEVGEMQPGDSVELTVTLKNTFDGSADWYMKNEVLESLEDAGDAEGGAYDYLLTYTDAQGETTTLYSSEKFGGEGKIGGEGLHGATNTLENYFYLDRMGNGDAGTVKLKVALDGETLVNDYQNTLARLQMDFAAELVADGSAAQSGSNDNGNSNGTGDSNSNSDSNGTGDSNSNGDSNGTGGGSSNGSSNGNGGTNTANGTGGANGANGTGTSNGSSVSNAAGGSRRGVAKTGDDTEVMRYVALMFGSGIVLLFGGILVSGRQKKERAGSEVR